MIGETRVAAVAGRRVPFGLGALVLLGVLAATPAAAVVSGCDALGPTRIVLVPVSPRPALDTSLDLVALRQLDSQHGDFTLGLTVASPFYNVEHDSVFAVSDRGTPRQQVCGIAKEIRARLGFENVIVHIAHEVTRDHCLYDEVYRHENRHLQVDRDVLDLYAPRLEANLHALVARMGVVRGSSADAVRHEILERVQVAVAADLKAFTQEMRRRQRFVDRPEEYRRLAQACGGAVGRLIDAARRAAQ